MSHQYKAEPLNNSPLGDGGIVIIADDFTGAAELAGISLRYGIVLPVFLYNRKNNDSLYNSPLGDEDIIICTDSRSLNNTEAKKVTDEAIKKALQLNPGFIYKKIDSVLRGHVIDEINVQLKQTGLKKALIVPANPSLGRTIDKGEYFINGIKISETGFANDPEFPVKSSSVNKMVGSDNILGLKNSDQLPVHGIVIGEATTNDDIKKWASLIDETWMLVGAGDFYAALLDKKHQPKEQSTIELQSPHLYICGTAFEERKQFIKTVEEKLNCVSYLPERISEDWFDKTGKIIKNQNKVIVAINESNLSAIELRTAMAKAAKEIIERNNIKEIFIEGGSTAALVLQELSVHKLSPVNELERGVVRMKANDLFITVKPGSYKLPNEIAELYG